MTPDTYMTVASIVCAASALWGTWLNVQKRSACFRFWAFSNVGWFLIDFYYGIWAQAFCHAVYLILAFEGLRRWKPTSTTSIPRR